MIKKKTLLILPFMLLLLPITLALGDYFNFTSAGGTVKVNGSDVCIISTGQCMSQLAGGVSYTAGDGLVLVGTEFTATAVNGTSNAMNNDTISDAVYSNITAIVIATNKTIMNNATINYMMSLHVNAINLSIMNNETVIDAVNQSGLLVNWSDQNISINCAQITDGSDSDYCADASAAGGGDANTNETLTQMFLNISYASNNTFAYFVDIMNNQTLYNMINAVSDNDTTIPAQDNETIIDFVNASGYVGLNWNVDGYIKNWNSSGYIIDWSAEITDNINSNESISQYINLSILPPFNNSLLSLHMNITGGDFTGDVNISKNLSVVHDDGAYMYNNGSSWVIRGVGGGMVVIW